MSAGVSGADGASVSSSAGPSTTVHGANMGVEAASVKGLSATLDPKTLRAAMGACQVPEKAHVRPLTALPQRAAGRSSGHNSPVLTRLMAGAAEEWRGASPAPSSLGPAKLLDDKALQSIRDELMSSLPHPTHGGRAPHMHAGMQARMHDSPSRSPVAERRFPRRGGAGERGVGGGGEGKVEARGLVGLQNLGNTCFINTCVQCLSNLAPFGKFFLSNRHIFKLNKNSSMKGTLVLSFGELLHKICHGTAYSSVSAATLREQVGKFAPQFTGCRQHDSQELLRFLLDGLHEDLCSATTVDELMKVYDFQQQYAHAANAQASMVQYYESNFSQIISSFGGQLVR